MKLAFKLSLSLSISIIFSSLFLRTPIDFCLLSFFLFPSISISSYSHYPITFSLFPLHSPLSFSLFPLLLLSFQYKVFYLHISLLILFYEAFSPRRDESFSTPELYLVSQVASILIYILSKELIA
uniref:Uncharacterized protein n=1 Tax=Cacopsylla melanoneura TaxID=428564 RepID=A0A8D9BGX5_9HEMI